MRDPDHDSRLVPTNPDDSAITPADTPGSGGPGGGKSDRPLMVYLVMLAGTAALILLLVIVWISATGNSDDTSPICLEVLAPQARAAILAGEVKRVDIVVDRTHPEFGPSALRLEMSDGACKQLPQGTANLDQNYMIIGVVDVFNSTGDQRVRKHYIREDIPAEFLTPAATETPFASSTPTPTQVVLPAASPVMPSLSPAAAASPSA